MTAKESEIESITTNILHSTQESTEDEGMKPSKSSFCFSFDFHSEGNFHPTYFDYLYQNCLLWIAKIHTMWLWDCSCHSFDRLLPVDALVGSLLKHDSVLQCREGKQQCIESSTTDCSQIPVWLPHNGLRGQYLCGCFQHCQKLNTIAAANTFTAALVVPKCFMFLEDTKMLHSTAHTSLAHTL